MIEDEDVAEIADAHFENKSEEDFETARQFKNKAYDTNTDELKRLEKWNLELDIDHHNQEQIIGNTRFNNGYENYD